MLTSFILQSQYSPAFTDKPIQCILSHPISVWQPENSCGFMYEWNHLNTKILYDTDPRHSFPSWNWSVIIPQKGLNLNVYSTNIPTYIHMVYMKHDSPVIKCTLGDFMTMRETQQATKGGGRNLRPAAIHVHNLHNEIPSFSDKPPLPLLKISLHLPFMACSLNGNHLSAVFLTRWLHFFMKSSVVQKAGLKGGWACLPLLPGLFHICGCLRFQCGFNKVLSDDFIPAQPPNATMNNT